MEFSDFLEDVNLHFSDECLQPAWEREGEEPVQVSHRSPTALNK